MKDLGRVSHTHLKMHNTTIQEYRVMFPDARFAYHPDSQREKISSNGSRSEKIRLKKLEYWTINKGKTIEEIRGKESADSTKAKLSHSLSGSKNPAFGKVYHNAGGKNRGWYRGFFFRSLYEYSYLKFLESTGIDITTQVISAEFYNVPYLLDGVDRTYHPDFEIDLGIIVEIKSVYEMTIGRQRKMNDAKIAAATNFFNAAGKKFVVLTERDFPVFTRAQADIDRLISWVKR